MEVVGVVAASTELIKAAWSCYELVKKLQNAPKRFEEYAAQLQSITSIAKIIREKEDEFQTAEVEKSLILILETVSRLESRLKVHELSDHMKSWRKIKNRIGLVADDNELVTLFDILEKQKSALSLLFTSELLHLPKIYGMVEAIHDRELTQTKSSSREQLDIVYVVPSRQCRSFVGRDDLVRSLAGWVLRASQAEDGKYHLDIDGIQGGPCTNAAHFEEVPPTRPGTQVTVIRALGGQGKSQIALHLCQKLRSQDLAAILWIDATSEATLRDHFATMSKDFRGDPDESYSNDDSVAFIIKTLQRSKRPWLMILDNYDDCQNFSNIREYIPDSPHGSIIVTSRHGQSSELVTDFSGKDIQLEGLDECDAVEFLAKASGIKLPDGNSEVAGRIARTLACHPLALAQAAAFIKRRRMRLPDFESYYEKQKLDILQAEPSMALSQYHKHLDGNERYTTLNVFTTWELSFKQLQSIADSSDVACQGRLPALLGLLELCAFTGPSGLSDVLLRHYFSPQKEGMLRSPHLFKSLSYFFDYDRTRNNGLLNSGRLMEGVADLADLSLIQSFAPSSEGTTSNIQLHPLVRDWLRLRIGPDHRINLVWYATSLVGSSLYEYFDEKLMGFRISSEQRREMLQHIKALADNYLDIPAAVPTMSECSPTRLQRESEDYKSITPGTSFEGDIFYDAVELMPSVSPTSSAAHTSPSKIAVENLFDLDKQRHLSANGDETMGDDAVACLLLCVQFCGTIYQEGVAEDIITRTFPDWQLCATAFPNNLRLSRLLLAHVQILYMRDEDDAAELLSSKFVELYDTDSTSDAIKCAVLFWYATALQNNSKHEQSMEAFRRAEACAAVGRGSNDPLTLECRGNIALCLSRMGRRDKSLEIFTSTIAAMKEVTSPDCPVAMDIELKASYALVTAGRMDEALAIQQDIMARFENTFGEEHAETRRSMLSLAKLLRDVGRMDDAVRLEERVAKLKAKAVV